jgi:hypothetical protein
MQHVITGMPTASSKNETIKATLNATKARRKRQRYVTARSVGEAGSLTASA